MSDTNKQALEWLERYPFLKKQKTGGLLNRAATRIYELEAENRELREALEVMLNAYGHTSFISEEERQASDDYIQAVKALAKARGESD